MPQYCRRLLIRFLVIILACLSVGFFIETPESIREHDKEVRRWQKLIKKNYDLKALRNFLDDQLKAHPTVDGIDLSQAKSSGQWIAGDRVLYCGDWHVSIYSTTDTEFTISWTYDDIPNTEIGGGIWKRINFNCRQKSKTAFELVSATRTEDEYIELNL